MHSHGRSYPKSNFWFSTRWGWAGGTYHEGQCSVRDRLQGRIVAAGQAHVRGDTGRSPVLDQPPVNIPLGRRDLHLISDQTQVLSLRRRFTVWAIVSTYDKLINLVKNNTEKQKHSSAFLYLCRWRLVIHVGWTHCVTLSESGYVKTALGLDWNM